MDDTAISQSWEEKQFTALINEGFDKFPYFSQLYFEAMRYYSPQWHGDVDKIEKFAVSALTRTRKKDGYGMYARIYWAATQSHSEGWLFKSSKVQWPLMSKGIDDVLAKYPDQWNINNFAFFSCLAEDKAKSREIISKIQGGPISLAWFNDMRFYNACKKWANSG